MDWIVGKWYKNRDGDVVECVGFAEEIICYDGYILPALVVVTIITDTKGYFVLHNGKYYGSDNGNNDKPHGNDVVSTYDGDQLTVMRFTPRTWKEFFKETFCRHKWDVKYMPCQRHWWNCQYGKSPYVTYVSKYCRKCGKIEDKEIEGYHSK